MNSVYACVCMVVVLVAVLSRTAEATTPLQCLAQELQFNESTSDSGSTDSSSGSDGTSLAFITCASPVRPTVPPLPPHAASNASPPATMNETLSCAATCGSTVGLERTMNGDVQFAIYNGSCFCVNETDVYGPNGGNASGCEHVAIFRLAMLCMYLNASLGCGLGCDIVDGCCQPAATPNPNELPSYYRTMIQWVAIVVIILALVEAIVYGCLRRRARERRQNRLRVPIREKRECKELTERLLGRLPASPSAAQEPSIAEDACPICLDPLTSTASLMLPCRHNIHKGCLRDYISHQLVRTNEVACPMCRAVFVEEDETAASSDGARPVRIAPPVVPTQQQDTSSRGTRGA